MMKAVCTSETSVYFNETTRRYIQEVYLKFYKYIYELSWNMNYSKQLITQRDTEQAPIPPAVASVV
jgi:hypothetical protein